MARPKVIIEAFKREGLQVYKLVDKMLIYDDKKKTLSGFSFYPSDSLLRGLGVNFKGFVKMTIPRFIWYLRKKPSNTKVKEAFRELKKRS
jgi:hypothetical protein